MNKKAYLAPVTTVTEVELTPLLEASIQTVGGDSGIQMGEGEAPAEADSRQSNSIWDDEF